MKKTLKNIEIFTDGACSGNPGAGGWGAILRFGDYEKEISGFDPHTTNNRMELLAVINAFKLVKEPCNIKVFTDSKYICDAINNNWAENWQQKGFKNKKNPDLWEVLLKLLKKHNASFIWIKGHNGHPENERCDKLAREAIKNSV